jgi:hypothetical protein
VNRLHRKSDALTPAEDEFPRRGVTRGVLGWEQVTSPAAWGLSLDAWTARQGKPETMSERPRLLVLDLLETYARERDIDVRLERRHDRHEWICTLSTNSNGGATRASGQSAREAIMSALEQVGVELP